jgi:hypothetical protein
MGQTRTESGCIWSNSAGDLIKLAGLVTVPGLTGMPLNTSLLGSFFACVSLNENLLFLFYFDD